MLGQLRPPTLRNVGGTGIEHARFIRIDVTTITYTPTHSLTTITLHYDAGVIVVPVTYYKP